MSEEVKEKNERCSCGGDIDCLYLIQSKPDIWQGRCFVCGRQYIVIKRFCNNKGGV